MNMLDNKYIPTAAEEKLLLVLANPEHFGKSVVAKCKEAGVVTNVYYDAFKKPGFMDLFNKMMLDIVRGSVGDILHAAIKFGASEKANNADRKMLLEMAGTYAPKMINELQGADGGPLQVDFGISRPKRKAIEQTKIESEENKEKPGQE